MSYQPTSEEVLKLREKTGYGLLDCKKALMIAKGNQEQAEAYLKLPFKPATLVTPSSLRKKPEEK